MNVARWDREVRIGDALLRVTEMTRDSAARAFAADRGRGWRTALPARAAYLHRVSGDRFRAQLVYGPLITDKDVYDAVVRIRGVDFRKRYGSHEEMGRAVDDHNDAIRERKFKAMEPRIREAAAKFIHANRKPLGLAKHAPSGGSGAAHARLA